MNLCPYLIFPGTCREALDFYVSCLDGEVKTIQTLAESPFDVPAEHADRIFNSVFVAAGARFMASDCEPGKEPVVGKNFALFLTLPDGPAQERVFGRLSDGGQEIMPLRGGFGMVEDRFGIQWMLALEHSL